MKSRRFDWSVRSKKNILMENQTILHEFTTMPKTNMSPSMNLHDGYKSIDIDDKLHTYIRTIEVVKISKLSNALDE